jgi:hypothetical protein
MSLSVCYHKLDSCLSRKAIVEKATGVITFSTRNLTGEQRSVSANEVPDHCPICHQGIRPVVPEWNHLSRGDAILERVFICPVDSCGRLFVGRYYRNPLTGAYVLQYLVPTEPQDYPHAPEIQQISPDFCSIYNQANKAEQLGLLLISGPGYRKSLEFLIKDYVTSLQETPGAKTDIADSPLMAVIKKYVTDKRMLTTAERATWLGNDETHYVRKWDDKDLQDMKNLIKLTCYWIQSEHLTSAAAASMPEGKK